ncbi:MAG: chromate efflux transporter [Opitutaceae bacterium]
MNTKTSASKVTLFDIFWIYLRLGCISFGGPVAHLGYFKDAFVNRRKWLSNEQYTELLGLCQFVPGPSSSQLGFAIGWHKGGLSGACMAWLGFTLPSALLMIATAYGLFALGESTAGFIDGLLIAAVAVVANATLGLGKTLCPDLPRLFIAGLCALLLVLMPSSWMQVVIVLLGFGLGNLFFKATNDSASGVPLELSISKPAVYGALLLYAGLLIAALYLNAGDHQASIYAVNYQAGALVFGGGHVVLPLLEQGMVPYLLSESSFLAGYSAAQALPGPLFTFSAFLGTASNVSQPAFIGGFAALIAIFLPGILLLIGLLPFWNQLRSQPWAKKGLIGANAAVVGLLLAALINPVIPHGIGSVLDGVIATVALIALYRFKTPAWLIVLICGCAGMILI